MDYGRAAAKLMGMDDATWERHANPLSLWTRILTLPLLVLAIWSRTWIGWWSLVPIGLTVAWIWLNPRAFPRPISTDNWGSKATFGERVWLNRKILPIPRHHARMAHLLSAVSGVGIVFLVWGLVRLEVWPTLYGLVVSAGAKLWFVDRMVWLYEDMRDRHGEYARWLR